ncbi:MAG: hypothetical protein ACOCYX_03655, partial [Spirochaetota bacterium]
GGRSYAVASTARSSAWACLYAWHPLAIAEVAGSGHQDAIGIALMLAALAVVWRVAADRSTPHTAPDVDRPRPRAVDVLSGGVLIGLAALVKPVVVPVALLGAWWWRRAPGRAAAAMTVAGVVVAAMFVPFVQMPGGVAPLFDTARVHAEEAVAWALEDAGPGR